MKPSTVLRLTTLVAAAASLVFSVWLFFSGYSTTEDKLNGIYVGIWVPSVLALGAVLLISDRKQN